MSKLKVTRDQLSKFIEDNNTVTQFERIFKLIDSLVIARTDISTDYAYTTTAQYMSYLVIDGLSSDITITVTDGGFDERSRFKVLNNDPTYKIIMTDGTLSFWVAPGQVVDFYLKGTTLMWASGGWETIYYDLANIAASVLQTALFRDVQDNTKYEVVVQATLGTYTGQLNVIDKTIDARTPSMIDSATRNSIWDFSALAFLNGGGATYPIKIIRQWHDAS